MLSTLQRLLTALLLSAALPTLAVAQDASQFDLSTNDGVNAAREAISGKTLDERSKNCLRRHDSLPAMVMVGVFAFDYGCRFQGVFIKNSYVALDDKSMSRTALDALGWKTISQPQREVAAHAWVVRGLLGFSAVLSATNEHFAQRSFQPPQAATNSEGETVVTLWLRLPAGRVRDVSYQFREYKFSKDGDFLSNKTLETFTAARN